MAFRQDRNFENSRPPMDDSSARKVAVIALIVIIGKVPHQL